MSASTALVLAALVIGSGGLAGIVALVLASAKKSGQKQAEADYEQQSARDAKTSGAVVAEQRSVGAVADRLRHGGF